MATAAEMACRGSNRFHRHRPHHRRLIAVSKTITPAALAIALVVAAATALFDTRHLVAVKIAHVVAITIARPPHLLP